jgi:hypothetical protein
MAIDWGIVARAIHVVAVVIWIGGIWLVTTVLLPAMKWAEIGKNGAFILPREQLKPRESHNTTFRHLVICLS